MAGCGIYGGYWKHRRNGKNPCAECAAAWALAANHPDEYRQLLNLNLPPNGAGPDLDSGPNT